MPVGRFTFKVKVKVKFTPTYPLRTIGYSLAEFSRPTDPERATLDIHSHVFDG